MAPTHSVSQKLAGYFVPIFVGWVMIIWTLACTVWILNNSELSNWHYILIWLIWLPFFPALGYIMGMVNSFCWRNLELGENEPADTMKALGLFWLFTFPVTIVLICSIVGYIGLLFHMTFYMIGQERGKIWIANNTIEKILGKKNDWETDLIR